ncbi:hypothetical protein E5332_07465 [Enterorhabdus sp. NM05_H27]|uniref:hypothetical protein n=1 Tax=Adlercreutzia muris TaxID=1796610 RepID=UPI001094450F|nr:hypothetical protein E5332_07465 [Enterorhabdus sp. NM05_H27]
MNENTTIDEAQARAADAVAADVARPAETAEEVVHTYGEVRAAVTANRANTLALLGCLREVLEARPFREAEAAVEGSRAMALTMQNPHALYAILLKCGAVESIPVPEDDTAIAEAPVDDAAVADAHAEAGNLPDQPTDYLLAITDLGREALDEFEPAKRFGELLAGEPEGYRSAYDTVLACCEEGASKAAIEAALTGHPALAFPKQVYPGYFISKLETVDGISWDGVWRTTEAGQRMRALLA